MNTTDLILMLSIILSGFALTVVPFWIVARWYKGPVSPIQLMIDDKNWLIDRKTGRPVHGLKSVDFSRACEDAAQFRAHGYLFNGTGNKYI